ncbi:hypothetical protein [uncultured Olegusella sp.]|uniref:hypothetical protein n=1 Tax=uncultured Olegusella sp. TaxID=1979846 RepID=UPI002623A481|nr:hypothetical protein [uncultured Olegusella sp.]
MSEGGQQKSSVDTLYQNACVAAARLRDLSLITFFEKSQLDGTCFIDDAATGFQTRWVNVFFRNHIDLHSEVSEVANENQSCFKSVMVTSGVFYDLLPAGTLVDASQA